MSWPIRVVPCPTSQEGWAALRTGDCYLADAEDRAAAHFGNAPEHAGKPRWILVLPCGTRFCVHGPTWSNGRPGPAGWGVSGAPPNLTLTPSVNIGGGWHGFVKDGVIGDDVSGKAFP